MIRAVFTGPAIDSTGHMIVREDLINACAKAGIVVDPAIRPSTSVLVASRIDTSKAKAADLKGIPVMTYPQFLAAHLKGVAIEKSAKPHRFVDGGKVQNSMLVPDFSEDMDPGDVL